MFKLPAIDLEDCKAVKKISSTPEITKRFVKTYCETFSNIIDWKKQALNMAKRNMTAAEIDRM